MARGALGYQPLLRHIAGAENDRNNDLDQVDLSSIDLPSNNSVAPSQVVRDVSVDVVSSSSHVVTAGATSSTPRFRITRSMRTQSIISSPILSSQFICDVCSRAFDTYRGLGIHRRRVHQISSVSSAVDPVEASEVVEVEGAMAAADEVTEPVFEILPDDVLEVSSRHLEDTIVRHDISNTYSSSPVAFLCAECGRSFGSKTGLGVHRKRAHPLEYEAGINLKRKRARWSDEERRLLALREAELVFRGCDRINELLSDIFTERTFDAIKSQRRTREHKELVSEYMETFENQGGTASLEAIPHVFPVDSEETLGPYQDIVSSMIQNCSIRYHEKDLNGIWNDLGQINSQILRDRLSLYIKKVFPEKTSSVRSCLKSRPVVSRRQSRQVEYKRVQRLFKRSRARCINEILSPASVAEEAVPSAVFSFWKHLMTEVPGSSLEQTWDPLNEVDHSLWDPISLAEIRAVKMNARSAPGPDGVTCKELRKVPYSVLLKLFNLFLVLGQVPSTLLRSRTIFIPKGINSCDPSEFRPISITSVILRMFHKILAARIMRSISFDFRQRGFTKQDGCALNTMTLEMLIKHQRTKIRNLYLASLDVKKAFDSISFVSVRAAAEAAGFPPSLLAYIKFLQETATTQLSFKGTTSDSFHPCRGVRQGDPLSPILFNLVLDYYLRSIPQQYGINVGNTRFAALAYADDVLLMSSSLVGIQALLDTYHSFLSKCGLMVNVSKSFGLALVASGKDKKVVTDTRTVLRLGTQILPMKSAIDHWSYLGISYTPSGRFCLNRSELDDMLTKVRRGPLKPQQRLYALRCHVIPKLLHELILGSVRIGFLNQMDCHIRQEVRKWLKLPHDVPVSYFHSGVKDGGLGIPSLRWTVPCLKVRRLEKVREEVSQSSPDFINAEIRQARTYTSFEGNELLNNDKIHEMWRQRLYDKIDGELLKDSRKVKSQHNWISDGSNFLNSKDYINCTKLRINALPTRSRTTRGRAEDRSCRAGCSAPETINHILQVCHRTHDARVKRHNAIADYAAHRLESKGFVVVKEPHFNTSVGLRKPDLIAVKDQRVYVLDAQVVGEKNLKLAHERKCNYYAANRSLRGLIGKRFNTNSITFHSLTLNYVGIWSNVAADDLLTHGLINLHDVKIISSRVLMGGVMIFNWHSRMTSRTRD